MSETEQPQSFLILGKTVEGERFRPSDWAERLCGVMSQYRPGSAVGAHLTYSPWVIPGHQDGVKCVKVDAKIYRHEPLAYRFLQTFASDNNLVIAEQDQNCVKITDSLVNPATTPVTNLAS